ncbi:MAG: ABC transporter transmembrane domain-containing protein [Actinomycetota bacterium]|nr:ABC transporter transmembrane domain-containing protein [Actinomycetota bacterium]
MQSLSLGFFDRHQLGDVLSRVTEDVEEIEELVLSGVAAALSYFFQLIFFTAALFYLDWQLALVSLFVAPLFWIAARHFSRKIKLAAREERRRSGSISAVAEESLSNAALVQAYNRQDEETARFHSENEGSFEAQMAGTRLSALFSPLISIIELAGVLVVIAFGAYQLSQGRISIGGLLVFLVYLSMLYKPIKGFSSLLNAYYAASDGAERIIEFLDEKPSVVEREDAVALEGAEGHVELDGVSFYYPDTEAPALEEVSASVGPGEVLALVGPSGAGKSTVAKLLLRFYDPESGAVRLDGRDLRDLTLRSLRENVAVLLQETLVFDGTIRENIAYGKPGATEAEIKEAAEAADADDFIRALPKGYDTVIGQKGRLLSGGQRQRVAIARAMIRNAPVLILDEPTTGLDAESGGKVMDPLRRLMSGRTTIVISHNLLTVREATKILVLEDGAHGGRHARRIAFARRIVREAVQPPRRDNRLESVVSGDMIEAMERTDSDFTYTDATDTEDFLKGGPPGLEPGEAIAPGYTAIAHLHRSKNFDVYDVWSEERASRCIVKTPIPDRMTEKVARGLFREGRMLGKFTHPHIVRAYEIIKEPRPAVVVETLTGKTVGNLIDTSPRRLPLKAVAHLGLHLCSAIHYLHHHGILHLDLKPSNIVSERGVAKIIDLSIARKPGRGKKWEGTFYYMAPEQVRGEMVSPATDVWGIGAVLFEAATDEVPFNSYVDEEDSDASEASASGEYTEHKDEDYEQIQRRVEPVNKHRRIPRKLAETIEACLEPEPDDRPTVAELSQRLGEFLEIKAF